MNSSVWAIWAELAVRKKSGFEFSWATFEGGFFNFLWEKKTKKTQKLFRKTQDHFFSLIAWAAQKEEFMFQNVA